MSNDPRIQALETRVQTGELEKIVFAGGCFWCTEASFDPEYGVVQAFSGYFGGKFENPTYEQVSGHQTDHRESVIIYYNNASTSLPKLLVNYWHSIDPTQTDGQFSDIGFQYTTAIYYFTDSQKQLAEASKQVLENSKKFGGEKIAVQVLSGQDLVFYPAEEYHQNYAEKNPVRYEYFKKGSGRTDFIKTYWSKDHTFDKFIEESRGEKKFLSGEDKTLPRPR